jgi:phage shock protein E
MAAPAEVGGGFVNLTPAELQAMLEDKDFPLINVHIPFEGDLPDTDLSIPFDEIAQHLDQLPADRDAKIVLYCRSGSMSAEAAVALAELGYTQVFHLDGGFRAWVAEGLPLIGG